MSCRCCCCPAVVKRRPLLCWQCRTINFAVFELDGLCYFGSCAALRLTTDTSDVGEISTVKSSPSPPADRLELLTSTPAWCHEQGWRSMHETSLVSPGESRVESQVARSLAALERPKRRFVVSPPNSALANNTNKTTHPRGLRPHTGISNISNYPRRHSHDVRDAPARTFTSSHANSCCGGTTYGSPHTA